MALTSESPIIEDPLAVAATVKPGLPLKLIETTGLEL
jgi:hypothetical protein